MQPPKIFAIDVSILLESRHDAFAWERRTIEGLQIGFIDTDCLRDVNKVFDAAELVGIYTDMQKLTSKTFKAALSDAAKKEWM